MNTSTQKPMWHVKLVLRASAKEGGHRPVLNLDALWEDEGRSLYVPTDDAVTRAQVVDLLGEILTSTWMVHTITHTTP